MYNKGQVTLIVIVGIMILIAVATVLYLKNETSDIDSFDDSILENGVANLNSLNSIVSSCLDDVLYDTPHEVLDNHFYFKKVNLIRDNVPYFYFTGTTFFPTKEQVELDYSSAYREDVLSCINNFDSIKKYLAGDLVFNKDLFELELHIDETEITAVANTHAYINLQTGKQLQDSVSFVIPSNLGTIYNGISLFIYPLPFKEYFFESGFKYFDENGFSCLITAQQDGDLTFYIEELNSSRYEHVSYVFNIHTEFSN